MDNPFVRKLRNGFQLSAKAERILDALCGDRLRFEARRDIAVEGDDPRTFYVVLEGWACHYKQLVNGKRQIVSLLVPGDLSPPTAALPHALDHTVATVTTVVVAQISTAALADAFAAEPLVEKVFSWNALLATAMLRESVVSLGRRSAMERLAHFICELHFRLSMIEVDDPMNVNLPITQSELADLLGLSTVHINRSLQHLRAANLITLVGHDLRILNLATLREVAHFDPSYLQQKIRTDLNFRQN